MTRAQILKDKEFRFKVWEFVCPHVYERFGEAAWEYIDIRLLETVLFIRKGIGLPMTINTWKSGGTLSQRGLRCNLCDLVKNKKNAYLSAHVFGQAVDFNINGMDAESVRQWLEKNKSKLPYPIRLERDTTWVHLDVRNDTAEKIVYFNG